jgi:DNA sulfur modification protein DndD
MIIRRVEIDNFRQYRGPIKVELGLKESRNVNVLVGSTGAGKTNFNNALNWCFYGRELSLEKDVDFPIWNLIAFNEISSGKPLRVRVQVLIELDNNEQYLVSRSLTVIKDIHGTAEVIAQAGSSDKTDFRIDYFSTGKISGSYDTAFPLAIINQIAPERIREFFFFDGEKLGRYFNADSSREIKEAIFNVSQLDILQRIQNRFESVRSKYHNLARECSPKSNEIGGKLAVIDERILSANSSLEKKRAEYSELGIKLNDLKEKYQVSGGDAKRVNLKAYDLKNSQLLEWEEMLQKKMMEKRFLLMRDSYLLVGHSALDVAHELFKKAEEKNEIPAPLPSDYLEALISKGQCICGARIEAKEKKQLEILIQLANSSKQNKDLMHIGVDISNLLSHRHTYIKEQLSSISSEIESHTSKIQKLKGEIEALGITLKDTKEVDLDRLWEMIQTAEETRMRVYGDIKVEDLQLKEKQEEKSQLEKELEKENAKTKQGIFYNSCTQGAADAMQLARLIQEKVMNEVRIEIAKETEKHYAELHWKKDEKVAVVIDNEYNLQAIQAGKNKLGAFSAGEKALMAISFIIALNRVSGFSTPIVMDAALGRIDVEPARNFAKNIATYLKGTQIIFLFTSVEYSAEVKKYLEEYMFGKDLNIKVGNPSPDGAQQSSII